MAQKNTQSLGKNRFLSIEPRYTSSMTSNHSKSCRESFLYILTKFEFKRTLFGKTRKRSFKMMIFAKKIYHRPFESDKNISNSPIGLKIYQHNQFE